MLVVRVSIYCLLSRETMLAGTSAGGNSGLADSVGRVYCVPVFRNKMSKPGMDERFLLIEHLSGCYNYSL